MNDIPKVSVIMACHNAAQYIEYAITSVLSQSFENLELIIVDDFSSDESLALSRKAALLDSRIKVFALEKNGGPGAARNFAIDQAQGEWLAILDADDVFLPDKIQKQLDLINRTASSTVLIGTDSFEIDENGNRNRIHTYPATDHDLKRNLFRLHRFPPHSSLIYRTDAVRAIGGFNPRYPRSQDYELWLRLSKLGSFLSVPEPLVEYRQHDSNISKTDFGFKQMKYGIAGGICYNLRDKNCVDPSQDGSIDEWNVFLEWLDSRLVTNGELEFLRNKYDFIKIFQRNKIKLFNLITALKFSFMHPAFIGTVIKRKIFGNDLPKQLAQEWQNYAGHR